MSDIWIYVGLVFAPFGLMGLFFIMAYLLNVKFKAFVKRGNAAVIRILNATAQNKVI